MYKIEQGVTASKNEIIRFLRNEYPMALGWEISEYESAIDKVQYEYGSIVNAKQGPAPLVGGLVGSQ